MHDEISKTLLAELQKRLTDPKMSHRKLEVSLGLETNELKGILDASQPRTPSVAKAKRIADALGLELYLGPPRETVPRTPANPDQFVRIPCYDAGLSAGAGADNQTEAIIEHLAFRREWLRNLGVAPDKAVIARARGDSMLPTIHAGDMLLIDTGRAIPPDRHRDPADKRPAKIFALLDNGLAKVKRLELASPNILAILSDNPEHPPEFRDASAVSIVGRVMWWGHTNRD